MTAGCLGPAGPAPSRRNRSRCPPERFKQQHTGTSHADLAEARIQELKKQKPDTFFGKLAKMMSQPAPAKPETPKAPPAPPEPPLPAVGSPGTVTLKEWT